MIHGSFAPQDQSFGFDWNCPESRRSVISHRSHRLDGQFSNISYVRKRHAQRQLLSKTDIERLRAGIAARTMGVGTWFGKVEHLERFIESLFVGEGGERQMADPDAVIA